MLSLTTHEFEKIPNTSQYRITNIRPYVRLGKQAEAFYIQGGKVYRITGDEEPDPPAWVFEEAKKLTPAVRAEVGWKDPEPVAASAPAAAPAQTLHVRK